MRTRTTGAVGRLFLSGLPSDVAQSTDRLHLPLTDSPESDWLDDFEKKLAAMATLRRNWDSYGAESPSARAMHDAMTFLENLHDEGSNPTRIAPSAIGGVGITIKRAGCSRRGYVEFRNDGGIYCLLSDGVSVPIVEPVRLGMGEFKRVIEKIEDYLNGQTVSPQTAPKSSATATA